MSTKHAHFGLALGRAFGVDLSDLGRLPLIQLLGQLLAGRDRGSLRCARHAEVPDLPSLSGRLTRRLVVLELLQVERLDKVCKQGSSRAASAMIPDAEGPAVPLRGATVVANVLTGDAIDARPAYGRAARRQSSTEKRVRSPPSGAQQRPTTVAHCLARADILVSRAGTALYVDL